MNSKTRVQLSTLMFLQYFVWGTWYVTISTYLTNTLHFEPIYVGLSFGTLSIAAMVSPFFVGLVADKYFSTEKVLGFLHLVGGVLLYIASMAKTFSFFYPALLAYTLAYTPTIALSNSISFHQMKDPGKQFPGIRVLGTIGWIAAGITIGQLKLEASVGQLHIGAVASVLLGIYCLTLPHVPPKKAINASFREILGLDALKLFKNRGFAVVLIASVLTCIPLSFYYSWTNPFLNDIGMKYAATKMTLGQAFEIIFLLIMPFFFAKLGVKKMLMLGMTAWILRYLLFAYGNVGPLEWMLYVGIILHGICYDFFFVTGQIYVDKKAPDYLKASAQGMITFATYGLGIFIGSWFAGKMVGLFTIEQNNEVIHQWTSIWYIPTIIAIGVLIFFILLFREKHDVTEGEVQAAV